MEIVACKFGGTSTADSKMLKRIHEIISENPDRRYVVLSAPGRNGESEKVTDMLYAAWRDGCATAVIERFEAIAHGLGVQMDFKREIDSALRVSEAYAVSRGEALCARLFSAYTGMPFVDAADIIFFDDAGRINLIKTKCALRDMARAYPRAVIPGFYGSGPDGRIVTFPRNGSDITGALVAAGIGAALYENWTDVPGLMTGDPATDAGATVIPDISYRALRGMSAGGLQVLHPDSLDAVEKAGIPIRIRCTMHPEATGTLIHV